MAAELEFLGAPGAVDQDGASEAQGRTQGGGHSSKRARVQHDSFDVAGRATMGITPSGGGANKRVADHARDRFEHERWMRTSEIGLTAYEKHVRYVNNFVLWYEDRDKVLAEVGAAMPRPRNDYDVLAERHKFVWTEDDLAEMDWEKEQAYKYYQKLFKEYAIADLSQYEANRIAMRWRTKAEVLEGKGQFTCGAVECTKRQGLASYEVNFGYIEHGKKRSALVKLRVCPPCGEKLNYRVERPSIPDDVNTASGALLQVSMHADSPRLKSKGHKAKKKKGNAKKRRESDRHSGQHESKLPD